MDMSDIQKPSVWTHNEIYSEVNRRQLVLNMKTEISVRKCESLTSHSYLNELFQQNFDGCHPRKVASVDLGGFPLCCPHEVLNVRVRPVTLLNGKFLTRGCIIIGGSYGIIFRHFVRLEWVHNIVFRSKPFPAAFQLNLLLSLSSLPRKSDVGKFTCFTVTDCFFQPIDSNQFSNDLLQFCSLPLTDEATVGLHVKWSNRFCYCRLVSLGDEEKTWGLGNLFLCGVLSVVQCQIFCDLKHSPLWLMIHTNKSWLIARAVKVRNFPWSGTEESMDPEGRKAWYARVESAQNWKNCHCSCWKLDARIAVKLESNRHITYHLGCEGQSRSRAAQGSRSKWFWSKREHAAGQVVWCDCDFVVVRSPFRVKHHVVVQYMAWWIKCPLPPPPLPPLPPWPLPNPLPHPWMVDPPLPLDPHPHGQYDLWKTRRTRKNWWHYRQGTSHCSCLEHCFLLCE